MKLIIAFVILSLVVFQVYATTEQEYVRAFEQWMQEYGKHYGESELLFRFRIFKDNFDFVEKFNSEDHTFTVELNKFADLTNTEFLERYTGFRAPREYIIAPQNILKDEPDVGLPQTVDWRKKGAVTPVKDQGQCGSCWSFSATGSVEGLWAQNHSLVSLSEQNLMDCTRTYGNAGCSGGYMDNAFKYIINNRGIATESAYPYEGYTFYNCRYDLTTKGAMITGFKDVPSGSESALQTAVAKRTVSVAIDASNTSFQFYKGGYYYEPNCSSTKLDHGVLAVGYGTQTNGDYWLVKNSWGANWGANGYIYMARNKNNNCGIATVASYPF